VQHRGSGLPESRLARPLKRHRVESSTCSAVEQTFPHLQQLSLRHGAEQLDKLAANITSEAGNVQHRRAQRVRDQCLHGAGVPDADALQEGAGGPVPGCRPVDQPHEPGAAQGLLLPRPGQPQSEKYNGITIYSSDSDDAYVDEYLLDMEGVPNHRIYEAGPLAIWSSLLLLPRLASLALDVAIGYTTGMHARG
jgi:hypothetical protein